MSEVKKFKAGKRGLVYGVGINDADYATVIFEERGDGSRLKSGDKRMKLKWMCPYYSRWNDMIKRCYSNKFQETNPAYKGCSVSEEWKYFSNFRKWMVEQEWEGMQLDKDILVIGNKVYSAETSVFVTKQVNNFSAECVKLRGNYPIGVFKTSSGKYLASCNNPFTKQKERFGYFSCPYEAHAAWLAKKLEHAYALAAIQTDQRVAIALIERYENYTIP